MSLTQLEINELVREGYSKEDIIKAEKDMDKEPNESEYDDPRQHSQHSSFMVVPEQNLIKFQLQLDDILERAEHILRGDIPKFEDGHQIWVKNPHPELNSLNEFGIQELLKILAMYITRNTILSDYTPDQINAKIYDIGRRINNLFFMRYEEMGMDTENKRKNYSMIVAEATDIIESTYRRATHGGERRSLREMISVTQSGTYSGTPMMQPLVPKERGLLNPMRYIKGKNR